MAGIVTYAQETKAQTLLPGPKDYAKVEYFKDGTVAITNTSSVATVAKVHVKVTCTETYAAPATDKTGKAPQKTEALVVLDKEYTNIAPGKTLKVKEGTPKPKHNGTLSNFKIEIKNPTLAQEKPTQR